MRELRNAVEHALTVGKSDRIALDDLPAHILSYTRSGQAKPGGASDVPTLEDAETALIQRALVATGGNKQQAARMLRISRHRLYDKLRKLGMSIDP